MALTVGTLADGQLPSSKGTLYTVPTGKMAHVHVILASTAAPAGTAYPVNLYVKRSGGTSRRIIGNNFSLVGGGSAEVPSHANGIKLSDGDLIEGDCGTAGVVDYTIHGGVEATV